MASCDDYSSLVFASERSFGAGKWERSICAAGSADTTGEHFLVCNGRRVVGIDRCGTKRADYDNSTSDSEIDSCVKRIPAAS